MRRLLIPALLVLAACSDEGAAPDAAAPPESPVPPAPSAVPPAPGPAGRTPVEEMDALRAYAGLGGWPCRFHDLPPFLVAEAFDAKCEGLPPTCAFLLEATLPAVHDALRAFLLEYAGLVVPPIRDRGGGSLRWILFPDRRAFDRWHEERRIPNPGGIYHERGREGVVLGWTGGFSGEETAWVASEQLLARWKSLLLEEEGGVRLPWSHEWLRLGLASWFSTGRPAPGETPAWRAGLPATGDYDFVRESRSRGVLWSLEDILFADAAQIRARAKERSETPEVAEHLVALHASQSRLLVDTLLDGEGGRRRAGFGVLLRSEMRGRSGKVHLLKSFGLPLRSDDPEVVRWMRDLERACLVRLDTGSK